MAAMDAVVFSDNDDLLNRLHSYLSNPLQTFDYSIMQEAYDEIVSLRKAKEALFETINDVGELNIQQEKQIERWKNSSIDFIQKSREISDALIKERNDIYRIAEMFYLCVNGADKAFKDYQSGKRSEIEADKVQLENWKQTAKTLAHMLSKLDGGADSDKFLVEAFESCAKCYCDPLMEIYCELHW